MKKYLTLLMLLCTYTAWAQWNVNGNYTVSGNLGVGIETPSERLSIDGGILLPVANSSNNNSPAIVAASDDDFLYDGEYINHYGFGFHNFSDGNVGMGINAYVSGHYGYDVFTGGVHRLRVNNNGDVGIGTNAPAARLHISDGHGGEQLRITRGTGSVRFAQDNNQDNLYLFNGDASQTYMFWSSIGNIGIGTHQPDSKLTVKGDIHAREVRVDLDGTIAPDYVFEDAYHLMPIDEVATYVETNRHLPEVPSAEEMAANGLNLREMNLLLLKKVEELTLYVIELKEEIKELKNHSKDNE